MKKSISLLLSLLLSISFLSCQKAKEPEGKKETQWQTVHEGDVKQKPLPQEAESQAKKRQAVLQEVNVEKKEEGKAGHQSLVTDNEQKEFEKLGGGGIPSPNLFKSKKDALRYLKILLKGDVKTIRWYVDYAKEEGVAKGKYRSPALQYGDDICTALHSVALKSEEVFNLAIEVMNKKTDYPTAYACACEILGWYAIKEGKTERVKSAVSLLKDAAKNSDPRVRLEAAGSLLAVGEADVSLPVLDALAEQGEVRALVQLYEPENKENGEVLWTKLWDQRGVDILKKAMDYPSDEVKIWAANSLWKLGDIDKKSVERVALKILEKLKDKTLRDYGLTLAQGKAYEIVPLRNMGGSDLMKAEKQYFSDKRACDYAMPSLGNLKSKQAVPLLKHIHKKNTGIGYVCEENLEAGGGIAVGGGGLAENALKKIFEDRGRK